MTHNNDLPEFISLTGRERCGKGSYAGYLVSLGYMHVSAGDFLRERAREQGYTDPIDRSILSRIGDELKQAFGPHPITLAAINEYEQNKTRYPAGLVIDGLRRMGEIEAFKTHGAVQLWIDASDERRYEFSGKTVSFEDFMKRSYQEYFGTTEGGVNGVNLQALEAVADCRVINDGTLEALFANSDTVLRAHTAS